MDYYRKKIFLPYSFIGAKVLNDWVSLYGNAAVLNRSFSDPCITGAVIASFFLVWTGSYSLHYLWCNDSMQMGKSDQMESELWVLIRSSCSTKAESLSRGLKSSKHKFHIIKNILNLWKYKCKNSKFWNVDLFCFIINESSIFMLLLRKCNTSFLPAVSLSMLVFFFFLALNIFPERKLSTNKALLFQLYFLKF